MALSRRATLAGAAAFAIPKPAWAASADAAHALPFRFLDNQATVQVYMGAKGPFRFLLDSGAIHVGMSAPQLAALGLPAGGSDTILGASGSLKTQIYKAARMRVGDRLTLTDVGVRGLNIEGASSPNSAVGILPLHIFSQSLTNFVSRTVSIQDGLSNPPPNMLMFPANGPDDPRPYASAMLQGATIRVLLDTGYSGSLILTSKYIRESGLTDRYGKGPMQTLAGATGSVVASMMQVAALDFASHRFQDHWIELSDPALTVPAAPGYDGVIGMELLRRFDLWLDGRTGAVGLRPNSLIEDVERYDRSGLDLVLAPSGEPGLIVTHVSPESPAEKAGLKVFDRVPDFKGEAGLNDLRWALSGAPGSKVNIRVTHERAEQTITLVLN